MKLAIMQPYFFPYIGYFQLINAVDQFVLLNEVQYIRHGWINRNRILKPESGVQYIIVPLEKHERKSKIKDIQIAGSFDWKRKIIRQLEHYRKKAPCFTPVVELIEDIFEFETLNLAQTNEYFLRRVCDYIGVKTKIVSSCSLPLDYSTINKKEDWAITICEQLQAAEYVNPIGGIAFLKKDKFIKKDIQLTFLELNGITYSQRRPQFEPHLSIIDVMMFNEPAAIQKMLQQYKSA